jgi:hypothetical protein
MKLKNNLLLWNYRANLNQTLLKWPLGGTLSKLTKLAATAELNLTLDPMGNSHKNLLLWNHLLNKRITGHNFGRGHPRTIPPKFGCNWPNGFWGEDFYVNFSWGPMLSQVRLWGSSWSKGRTAGHCVRWSWLSNQDGRQAKNRIKGDEILKLIFSSETTEPISTKLCGNDPW